MVVTIADKTIEAKILEKEKAKEKYDDAIAAGNSAALMNETSQEMLSLQIGNLLPGQEAKVEMEIIQQVEIKEGAFDFVFPYKYFPSKIGQTEFEFIVSIESQSKLSQINHPKNFEILEKSD